MDDRIPNSRIPHFRELISYHERKAAECAAFGETGECRRHRDAAEALSIVLARLLERQHAESETDR